MLPAGCTAPPLELPPAAHFRRALKVGGTEAAPPLQAPPASHPPLTLDAPATLITAYEALTGYACTGRAAVWLTQCSLTPARVVLAGTALLLLWVTREELARHASYLGLPVTRVLVPRAAWLRSLRRRGWCGARRAA